MSGKRKPRRGNCYVTVESLYHLLGGKDVGLTPHTLSHEGAVHWYLVWDLSVLHGRPLSKVANALVSGVHASTRYLIIDPTRSQFKTPPPYHSGRGRGFLTKNPSKRAVAMMDMMVWQSESK